MAKELIPDTHMQSAIQKLSDHSPGKPNATKITERRSQFRADCVMQYTWTTNIYIYYYVGGMRTDLLF